MSKGHGDKLSRMAHEAALALVEENTLGEAAARLGINERSLRRWLDRDDFRELHEQVGRAVYQRAVGRMRGLCTKAARTLNAAMDEDGASATQVRAAQITLDFCHRADLSEIERRLTQIERTIAAA